MRRKDNYVMMKRATPKLVTLPDCRKSVARYKRVPRSRLPLQIKIRGRHRGRPWDKVVGDSVCHKKDWSGWEKSSQKNHRLQCSKKSSEKRC